MRPFLSRLSLLLLMALVLPAMAAFARQPAKKISGILNDAGSLPVPAASVTLLRAADSTPVKGAVTDDQGKFEFKKINNGAYLLVAL